MDRLVVLGGGSPFTAALIDALADAGSAVDPQEMVLHGRSAESLDLVARYATGVLGPLGWRIDAFTDLRSSLRDARIVVHQIRYGGLEGRAFDERTALRFGIQPDETLGPAAIQSLLRMRAALRATAEALVTVCPDAWILNLTNPLSVVTAVLARSGLKRCVGLCELPLVTAVQAAAVLGIPPEDLEWRYVGFNHRGFIVEIRVGGIDRIDDLVARLGSGALAGIHAQEIARLGAVPTKYFRILDRAVPATGGRASQLANLRDRILRELRSGTGQSPPSLRERYMEWYPRSVVPMIAALRSTAPSEQIVNVGGDDGLVREVHARVSRDRIEPLPIPRVEAEVARWIERFADHERRLLEFDRFPERGTLERALDADPMVLPGDAASIADELWAGYDAARDRS